MPPPVTGWTPLLPKPWYWALTPPSPTRSSPPSATPCEQGCPISPPIPTSTARCRGGFIPDIGAVIAFVRAATGRDPDLVVGKPNAMIAQAAARRAGLPVEQLCMVGDRLYTDIALGQNCPVKTALVLCGETTPDQAAQSDIRPTVTAQNLAELLEYLD